MFFIYCVFIESSLAFLQAARMAWLYRCGGCRDGYRCGGCSDKGKACASALSSIAAGSKCLASTGGFVVVQEFVMLMPNIWRSCFG